MIGLVAGVLFEGIVLHCAKKMNRYGHEYFSPGENVNVDGYDVEYPKQDQVEPEYMPSPLFLV